MGAALKLAAHAVHTHTGIDPAKISASSLRPGGATALLCGNIHKDTIKLIGRWRSDAIDTYLCTQATALTSKYSHVMLQHGDFTFNLKDAPATTAPSTKAAADDAYRTRLAHDHALPSGFSQDFLKKYVKLMLDEFSESEFTQDQ